MFDIYSNGRENRLRFTLGRGGARNLLVIGLNPSTATKEKSDTTISKVKSTAEQNGFDGFVMLNLYPVRATDYKALPIEVDSRAFTENLARIETVAAGEKKPVVWVAWGVHVQRRRYFVEACKELSSRLDSYGTSWRHFGPLTKVGHPRHPSRLNYSWSFSTFNIQSYLRQLGT